MKGDFRIGFKRKAPPSLFRGIVDFAKEDRDSFCMNRKTESGKEANGNRAGPAHSAASDQSLFELV